MWHRFLRGRVAQLVETDSEPSLRTALVLD